MINSKEISIFDWEQLEGKSLNIIVGKDTTENGETIVVSGYDKKENKIYILHCVQKGDHLV